MEGLRHRNWDEAYVVSAIVCWNLRNLEESDKYIFLLLCLAITSEVIAGDTVEHLNSFYFTQSCDLLEIFVTLGLLGNNLS